MGEEILAFVKYEGDLVKDGYLDARKSGEVLFGIDEMIRYFMYQENPDIKDYPFEIPVRVRKGSWETIFPENIESYAAGAFALWMAGKYAGSALEEIAKNDFKDVSLKKIFQEAFKNIVHVIKLAKHLGSMLKKRFENVAFSDDRTLVKVTNDQGDELWLPVEILELYSNCPQTIFNKLTKIIEKERELIIGLNDDNIYIGETITYNYKYIFTKNDDEEEIILPELKHGEYVELQGHITRGNEKANTIGFLYHGHIITCYPDSGNIKNQKNNMFNNCLMRGYVERLDKEGKMKEKRPRIRFIQIQNLEKSQTDLFS